MLSLIARLPNRAQGSKLAIRFMGVKVGDKIPISYIKDSPAPVILKDEEYPEWVMKLHEKLPTKRQMLEKIDVEGVESLSEREIKRTKRLITKEVIKQNNMKASTQ